MMLAAFPAPAGNASIGGVVLNERHEGLARVTVQAFPTQAIAAQAGHAGPPLMSMRASGSASTDSQGRFRIAGLEPGDYVIAAEPVSPVPARGAAASQIYAATFFPSTIDLRQAGRVSVAADRETTVQIELVRVAGARVSGSVVSASGRPTEGMGVRLFHRFGGFGSANTAALVGADGTFEIAGVAPGWYRLSIEPRTPGSADSVREFAETLIDVQDQDLSGLSLVLGAGAEISGRVVPEAGANVPSPIGLRVSASVTQEQFSAMTPVSVRLTEDWSFHMAAPSGFYQFNVSADRAPSVVATRVVVNGVETPAGARVALTDGHNEAVVFVSLREPPKPAIDTTPQSSAALVAAFKAEQTSWKQMEIGKAIVERRDASVLTSLVSGLNDDDRHARGNVAFVFAGLGDSRGFQVITDILPTGPIARLA